MSSSSSSTTNLPSSASPSSTIKETPSEIPVPIYQPSTSGSFIKDVYLTITNIGKVPCARNSLLAGIGSGLGIGVIRGLSASAMVAGNWGVAAFAMVSLGSWHLCQSKLAEEREKMGKVVEQMPQRMLKQKQSQDSAAPSGSGAQPAT